MWLLLAHPKKFMVSSLLAMKQYYDNHGKVCFQAACIIFFIKAAWGLSCTSPLIFGSHWAFP